MSNNYLDFNEFDSQKGESRDYLKDVAGTAGAFGSGVLGSPAQLGSLGLRAGGAALSGLTSLIAPEKEKKKEEPTSLYVKTIGRAKEFLDPSSSVGSVTKSMTDAISNVSNTAADYLDKLGPEKLKSYLDNATGGYTKPKGKFAAGLQEFSSDVGSAFGLGAASKIAKGAKVGKTVFKAGVKLAKTTLKNIAAGNTVKHTAKALGASEETANKLKMVSMITLPLATSAVKTMFNTGTLNKMEKGFYDFTEKYPKKTDTVPMYAARDAVLEVEEASKSGMGTAYTPNSKLKSLSRAMAGRTASGSIPVKDLQLINKHLDNIIVSKATSKNPEFWRDIAPLKASVTKGLKDSGSVPVKDLLSMKEHFSNLTSGNAGLLFKDSPIGKIIEDGLKAGGPVSVHDLLTMKRQLNDMIYGTYRTSPYFLKKVAPLKEAVMDGLKKYGKEHPTFAYALENADALHAVKSGAGLIEELAKGITGVKDKGTSKILLNALAYTIGGKKAFTALRLAGPFGKNIQAFAYSPAFRKHSLGLGKAIAAGSIPAAKKYIKNLIGAQKTFDANPLGYLK